MGDENEASWRFFLEKGVHAEQQPWGLLWNSNPFEHLFCLCILYYSNITVSKTNTHLNHNETHLLTAFNPKHLKVTNVKYRALEPSENRFLQEGPTS